jgi:hypothetical protein
VRSLLRRELVEKIRLPDRWPPANLDELREFG